VVHRVGMKRSTLGSGSQVSRSDETEIRSRGKARWSVILDPFT